MSAIAANFTNGPAAKPLGSALARGPSPPPENECIVFLAALVNEGGRLSRARRGCFEFKPRAEPLLLDLVLRVDDVFVLLRSAVRPAGAAGGAIAGRRRRAARRAGGSPRL